MINVHVTVPHHVEIPTTHDMTVHEAPHPHLTTASERVGVPPGLSGQPATGAVSSPWPASYALAEIPQTYDTSGRAGVFVNRENGQKFITANGRAYPVGYDNDNETYRIVDAENPSRPSYPVRLNPETGGWEANSDVGLKGGGDTAAERRHLQNLVARLQGQRDQAQQELQQAERDLQYVQSQVGANPPPSGDRNYVQQLQQRLDLARARVLNLEQLLMAQHQELDRLPPGGD